MPDHTLSSPLTGPRGLPFLGVALSLHHDALNFFRTAQQNYGDIVPLQVLGKRVLLLSNPSDVETVLVDDAASYGRSSENRNLRPIFGNGLLTSQGDLWRSQRRRIQPSFTLQKLAGYTTIMLAAIQERVERWTAGQIIEIHAEMMGFTRDVVCRSLFSHQPTAQLDRIADAVTTIFGSLRAEVLYLPIWQRLPTLRSIRWRRAVNVLYETIAAIINERRTSGTENQLDQQDMLGSLLIAQDEDGTTMSDIQIRDEVMTMFLAGHETSALILTWAIHLLAINQEMQDQAADEALRVTSDGPLAGTHYPQLKLIMSIVQESLRLYPPIWSISREAIRATNVGPHAVAKGDSIWMCINNIHHDSRWYQQPETFNPDRWSEPPKRPKLGFMPFGAGARMCIGQNFAFMEAVLTLATLLRNFRFHPASTKTIQIEAWITLRPKSGIPIRVERR